jgi:RNA polymerase sigma-70 factor (ECF subfamily)
LPPHSARIRGLGCKGPSYHGEALAQSDAQLVEQARAGPGRSAEDAFAALAGRYGDPIYRWIAARIRRPGDAEELAAEAFVRAWKSLGTLERPEWFRPWLFRIAGNLVRDFFAGKGMHDPRLTGDAAVLDSMESAAATPELRIDLEVALRDLPEAQRRALDLRFQKGMTYQEIATLEGVSTDTVKQRVSDGRRRLERALVRGGWLQRLGPEIAGRRARPEGSPDAPDAPGGARAPDGPAGAGDAAAGEAHGPV